VALGEFWFIQSIRIRQRGYADDEKAGARIIGTQTLRNCFRLGSENTLHCAVRLSRSQAAKIDLS